MALSESDLKHVAKLAALSLSEGEIKNLQKELEDILGHVDCLSQISTLGVVPTYSVTGEMNNFREDLVRDSLEQEKASQNAPDFERGGFKVPRIL